MNSSHVATGTTVALLANVLVYLSHWPLQPLDSATATSIAGLLVVVAGAVAKLYQTKFGKPTP